ncbi:MAG: QcrA and Rieske domain-containing protein [Blastococcus sp.]
MTVLLLSRRGVLRGSVAAALGAVGGYLVARTSAAARSVRGATAANAYGPSTMQGGHLLIALDRVPNGGGVILKDAGLVLTRSADGAVHAFSAVCTHQGCTVATVAAGTIDCPCHGSRFDAITGAVRLGPAARPLAGVPVTVRAGNVYSS